MSGKYVQPIKTIVTEHDIITAIKQSYHSLFNSEISIYTLAILCAQIFLECGRGKICFNYNLGNIKQTKEHVWTMYRCSEIINGKEKYFDPPHPQTHFNAYDSLPQAALEHLKFLNTDRYRLALNAANIGDLEEYVIELKKAGYFTASLAKYLKPMLSIYKEILEKYSEEVDPVAYTLKDIRQNTL